MLRSFSVENFGSIRERLELSFLATNRVPNTHHFMATLDQKKVSHVTALVGANGSGKTSILKALSFVDWFMSVSFQAVAPKSRLPLQTFANQNDKPTSFEAEYESGGEIWRYFLKLTPTRVLHESLYCRRKSSKNWSFVYLFKRDWDDQAEQYQVRKNSDFDLPLKEAKKVRENTSLISTAAQYGVSLAIEMANMSVFSNVTASGNYSFKGMEQVLNAAEFFHDDGSYRDEMNLLLSDWDLGLSDVVINEQVVTNEKGDESTIYMPSGVHKLDAGEFHLPFLHESSGTRAAFVLLGNILPALRGGGLVIIDELESDLHPHMVMAVADLFFSPNTNPKGAQLICSTHNHEILHLLHKEQIVLVEKDDTLNTDAWRLDDMEGVRSDDNFHGKYLAGAYGAVPEI